MTLPSAAKCLIYCSGFLRGRTAHCWMHKTSQDSQWTIPLTILGQTSWYGILKMAGFRDSQWTLPLTILGLTSWYGTLKMDGFSYSPVLLQLILPYFSAAVCCTLISSQIFISREVWFLWIIGCSRYQPSGHSNLIFFPQLSPSRCNSTGENRPRNSIYRKSLDSCLGLSLSVFSASFNYKALFNYWMKEAGKPKQLEHA